MVDKTFIYKELDYQKDGKLFVAAWQKAFDRIVDNKLFDWIFGVNSNNHIYVAICEEDNKIAGGYCLMQQEALINSESCISYLCNNVFTVPEYRIYNVFVRLGRFALEQKIGGRNVAIGFPNQQALPGHKRVGWTICEPIAFFERIPFKAEINSKFSLTDIRDEDFKEIEILWREKNRHSTFCIIKNNAFFKWRYYERPQLGRRYIFKCLFKSNKLVGYIILSHYFEKNIMHIIDIMASDPDAYTALILNACNLAHDIKADTINTWGSPILKPFLTNNGFSPSGEETRFIVKDLSITENRNIFESMKLHNIVLGDNDVF